MSKLMRRLLIFLGIVESEADAAYWDRCHICHRALRTIHHHGVKVMPGPLYPPPPPPPLPEPYVRHVKIDR